MSRPPANYVPGIGRGATGFTTRADLGPAANRGPIGSTENLSESNFDSFNGYQGSLFANLNYEKDDEEADQIWENVEKKLKQRNQTKLSKRKRETVQKPAISDQFKDLKEGLKTMTAADWDSIPEASTGIKKRRHVEKFTPVPDSVLVSARNNMLAANSVSSHVNSGLTTSLTALTPAPGVGGDILNNISVSSARNQLLTINLDRQQDHNTPEVHTVDREGYITELDAKKTPKSSEIGDIINARALYKSLTTSNPKNASGWIAAARLEEFAGDLTAARKKILKGCTKCKYNAKIWVEAYRLFVAAGATDEARGLITQAVKANPTSVKLWLSAVDLENESHSRKNVLRRALEHIPNSEALWKALVEEFKDNDPQERKDVAALLERAVESVPSSVDLWLGLARVYSLDTEYMKAKKVLNAAREEMPFEPKIWISAMQLEEKEQRQSGMSVDQIFTRLTSIFKKCLKSFRKNNVILSREKWISHITETEQQSSILTCKAIVFQALSLGLDSAERQKRLPDDAKSFENEGLLASACFVWECLVDKAPHNQGLWLRFVSFAQRHKQDQEYVSQRLPDAIDILTTANECCPRSELLWLMRAKLVWQRDGTSVNARRVLDNAFKAGHNSPRLWFAVSKLEWENGNKEEALNVLDKARESLGDKNAAVWMKSAVLKRLLNDYTLALQYIDEAIKRFTDNLSKNNAIPMLKILIMKIQTLLSQDDTRGNQDFLRKNARDALVVANRIAPGVSKSDKLVAELWCLSAFIEQSNPNVSKHAATIKARSVFESARLAHPENEHILVKFIKFEVKSDNEVALSTILSKALKDPKFQKSGSLWSLQIKHAPKLEQKAKSALAMEKCPDNPFVLASVAALFWRFRKSSNARKYYRQAVNLEKDNGDIWAAFFAFECAQPETGESKTNRVEQVLEDAKKAEPKHGDVWPVVAKDPALQGLTLRELLQKVAEHDEFML